MKMLFLQEIYETLSALREFLANSDIMATSTLGLWSFLQQTLKVALKISFNTYCINCNFISITPRLQLSEYLSPHLHCKNFQGQPSPITKNHRRKRESI